MTTILLIMVNILSTSSGKSQMMSRKKIKLYGLIRRYRVGIMIDRPILLRPTCWSCTQIHNYFSNTINFTEKYKILVGPFELILK